MNPSDNQISTLATVLVVDDDPGARLLVGSALEVAGFRVITAEDGSSALNLFNAHPTDCVVLDVVMPGMSGIELAQTIRARWPALPVILTSGYSHVLAEAGSKEFELVHKPYSMESLAALLS